MAAQRPGLQPIGQGGVRREQPRRSGFDAKMDELPGVNFVQLDWPGLLRQRMVRGAGEAEGICGDLGLCKVGRAAGSAGDGKIKPVIGDHLCEGLGNIVMQGKDHLGVRSAEGGDHRRHHRRDRRGRRPDPQRAAQPTRMIAQSIERFVERGEQRFGLFQEVQPQWRRGRRTAAAVEECTASDLLDLSHGFGQRRGHHPEPVRGAGKAALRPDRVNGPQMTQVEVRIF